MNLEIEQYTSRAKIKGTSNQRVNEVLTPEAVLFLTKLHTRFNSRRKELLLRRARKQQELDAGIMPDFLEETRLVRAGNWTVAPLPEDMLDRRVEITGPVERKMCINALNSGANVFMADFEDSNSPTWKNIIDGQINLKDVVDRTITYTKPEDGKIYSLKDKTATLMVRPRGWHLTENHFLIDDEPISASLFDFGLFFFHNAEKLIKQNTGPYFYLPKLENHLEARLWNNVFLFAQNELGIPVGTIKATVLIETILAVFEMDEILYELSEHSAGLNCGRWDYIFSFIKKFRKQSKFILPDRSQVSMTSHFMRSYSLLAIKTCHKRNVHAIGGMAAQIPIKNDLAANEIAFNKVRADKEREVTDGHDGTWVAHPGLVQTVKEIFDTHMPSANQIDNKRTDINIKREDLLSCPVGLITPEGLKTNIDVGIRYLESWLRGNGCVPINNLMEDTATAEISRAQIWQWINNPQSAFSDGTHVDEELYTNYLTAVVEQIKNDFEVNRSSKYSFRLAVEIFDSLVRDKQFSEFLTLKAQDYLDIIHN